jgi:hypothetical protein
MNLTTLLCIYYNNFGSINTIKWFRLMKPVSWSPIRQYQINLSKRSTQWIPNLNIFQELQVCQKDARRGNPKFQGSNFFSNFKIWVRCMCVSVEFFSQFSTLKIHNSARDDYYGLKFSRHFWWLIHNRFQLSKMETCNFRGTIFLKNLSKVFGF